jgi:hypothetical protein
MVAASRTFPSDFGFASRHCFAVIPNNAILSMSASSAYTKFILSFESVGGIECSLMASV